MAKVFFRIFMRLRDLLIWRPAGEGAGQGKPANLRPWNRLYREGNHGAPWLGVRLGR